MHLRITALAALLAGHALPATAYSNLVVFGDSLSDAGTFQLIAFGGGKFTTNPGSVWSENLAARLGTSGTPAQSFTLGGFIANSGGSIWAQGGARVDNSPGYGLPFAQPVSTQIGAYLAQNGGRADSQALYALWAGANDVFYWTSPTTNGGASTATIQAKVGTAAQTLVAQAAKLQAAGAARLIMFNLPDLGQTPSALAGGSSAASGLSTRSQLYNTTLAGAISGSGLRVLQLDTNRLFAQIVANPGAYGFGYGNNGVACLPAGSTSLTCTPTNYAASNAASAYLFADSVHPTSAGHRIIADYAYASLLAPTLAARAADQTAQLPEAQWRVTGERLRRYFDGQHAAGNEAFVGGDIARSRLDAEAGQAPLDGQPKSLVAGVDRDFGNGWFAGLALAVHQEQQRLSGIGSYRANGPALTLFAGRRLAVANFAVYFASEYTFADASYSFRRDFSLGIASGSETADGSAKVNALKLSAGYDLAPSSGSLRHGPQASLAWRKIAQQGYTEGSGNATAMRFGAQNFSLLRPGLGYRASWQASDQLRLAGHLSREYEQRDSYRELSIGIASTVGNLPMPVGMALRGGYSQASASLDYRLDKGSYLTLGVSKAFGRQGSNVGALQVSYGSAF
jgi:outer membrane lipase/esterase